MSAAATAFNFSIDVPVRTEWANVDLLRSSVQSCFMAMFSNVDGCHALAMVTGELLENAIKYGDWSGQRREFRLRVWGEGHQAQVSVENPVRPGDPGAREVVETLRWMAGFPSAEEAYRAKLLEVASAARDLGGSKLGLARIAYEGSCTMNAEIVDNVLTITASMRL